MPLVRIFLVDDDRFIIDVYKNILEIKSHEVVGEAYDGADAVEKYRAMQVKPDIVILDHRMPIKNGLSAMKEIQDLEPLQCVIFATADYEAAKFALKNGAQNFIIKPFKMDVLFNSIEVTLAGMRNKQNILKEKLLGIITTMNTRDPADLASICDRVDIEIIEHFVPKREMNVSLETMGNWLCEFFNTMELDFSFDIDDETMNIKNTKCTWMEKYGQNPSFCFIGRCIISRFAKKTGRKFELQTNKLIMDNADECVFGLRFQ